ncbi:hypothetical protein EON65_31250 [archaeon]|nr:MAG: hypothetical protein EON65_31250 [archaeon]
MLIQEICKRRSQYCGTTAVGVFIINGHLVSFNIGDSMAVLCRGNAAHEMNEAHKPGRKDETERIQRANGWITEEKYVHTCSHCCVVLMWMCAFSLS